MFNRIARNLLLITLPTLLLCFALLEVLFRTVVPAAEIPYKYSDPEDRVLRYDPGRASAGVFTAGMFAQQRARWRINNDGWNSDIDYIAGSRNKPLIAVIGDSFVEAFQVDPEKNFAAVLRRRLAPDYDVYSFGMQGAPMSQYLHMSRYVARRFQPDIMVFTIVHNDFDESLRSLYHRPFYMQLLCENGEFVETEVVEYSSPRINQWIRKSATARYLWLNANIGSFTEVTKRGGDLNANIKVDEVMENRETIEDAVLLLVQRIQRENPDRKIVYMMDAPRFDIYAGRLASSNVRWLNDLMDRTCEEVGCHFIDLSAPFSEVFRNDSLRFDSPYDAHWNERGHRVAGEVLYRKLLEFGILRN
jgi:hypothetical protein